MKRSRRVLGVVVGAAFLCAPVFAEEPEKGQKPADQEVKEEQAEHAIHTSATTTTQTPLPPGLEKQGKVPPGLKKQGKTPHGWSQGKAWWKHGQPQPGSATGTHSSHSPHSNHGHGHH